MLPRKIYMTDITANLIMDLLYKAKVNNAYISCIIVSAVCAFRQALINK